MSCLLGEAKCDFLLEVREAGLKLVIFQVRCVSRRSRHIDKTFTNVRFSIMLTKRPCALSDDCNEYSRHQQRPAVWWFQPVWVSCRKYYQRNYLLRFDKLLHPCWRCVAVWACDPLSLTPETTILYSLTSSCRCMKQLQAFLFEVLFTSSFP